MQQRKPTNLVRYVHAGAMYTKIQIRHNVLISGNPFLTELPDVSTSTVLAKSSSHAKFLKTQVAASLLYADRQNTTKPMGTELQLFLDNELKKCSNQSCTAEVHEIASFLQHSLPSSIACPVLPYFSTLSQTERVSGEVTEHCCALICATTFL